MWFLLVLTVLLAFPVSCYLSQFWHSRLRHCPCTRKNTAHRDTGWASGTASRTLRSQPPNSAYRRNFCPCCSKKSPRKRCWKLEIWPRISVAEACKAWRFARTKKCSSERKVVIPGLYPWDDVSSKPFTFLTFRACKLTQPRRKGSKTDSRRCFVPLQDGPIVWQERKTAPTWECTREYKACFLSRWSSASDLIYSS